ncbi:sensor histidine kinase [Spirosoma endbachense]|uniref:Signal transduction histidine kinase internal region domain-containing protein n=1 Tax=Spirosoma endbachense TaxID=2666025 RepID=A0A6P1VXT5_9BACT|nr:sensor histidine kinase [Spirosoma endbachense]QHV97454.1 hypothetical protein GJR95_21695 [Spirosoma endbachense]
MVLPFDRVNVVLSGLKIQSVDGTGVAVEGTVGQVIDCVELRAYLVSPKYLPAVMPVVQLFMGLLMTLMTYASLGQSSFVVETIGLRQGLPASDIRALFRDAKGYLWLGTDIGLVRYDGFRFETISVSQEGRWLGVVNALAEDKDGQLWVGTEDGLFVVRNGAAHAVKSLQTDRFLRMNCLIFDKQQNLWCGTSSGAYAIDKSDLQKIVRTPATAIQPRPLPGYERLVPELAHQRVFTLAFDEKGRLYAGANYGLFRYEKGKQVVRLWPNQHRKVEIQALAVRSSDDLVFTTFDPLGYIRLHNGNEERFFPNIYSTDVVYQANQFWYLSYGLHRQGPADNHPISLLDLYEKTNSSFNKLYIDREGIFWVATNEGLLKIRRSFFERIPLPKSVSGSEINGFGLYDNKLLVGAHHGRVFTWERDTLKKMLAGLAPIAGVSAIKQDSHRTLWLATTYQGLFSFDGWQTRRYTLADGLVNEAFNAIIPGKSGRLWAVGDVGITQITYDSTSNRYRLQFYEHKVNRYKFTIFFSGLETSDGTLWLASDFGLVSFRNGQFQNHLLTVNQTTVRSVRKIVQDKNGHIWLATEGSGLLRGELKNGQFTLIRQYTQQDGLPSNSFSDLLVDSSGRIWAVATTALTCLSINRPAEQIQNFDYKDGFFSESFLNPHLIEYPVGTLWVGSTEGLLRVSLNKLHPQHPALSVLITDVRLRDESGTVGLAVSKSGNLLSDTSEIRQLSASQNALTFRLALLSLANPGFNRYRYRLDGAESTWRNTSGSESTVTYSGLKPGHYTFSVRGTSASGIWSKTASFSFDVLPPFWQRLWFLSLLAIGLATGIWLLIRFRERRIKRQETERSRMAQLIAELETRAIRAQMNPHFIFNCLNSIQECILADDTDTAYRYLSKFSRLLRMVLEESARNIHSLQHELDLIRLYLELEALRFEQPLHYAIDIDSEVDTHNWQVPSLIFQPLVENAIWHGLVHQTGPRKLQIAIRLDGPNRLLSVIDDNGVGRKKASESRKTVYGTSQGLKLVAERITLLEKSGWGQGSLQIDDLTDATGEPGGTRVSVWLPIITELSLRTKFTHTTTHVQSTGH